jgi:hypothetical protein
MKVRANEVFYYSDAMFSCDLEDTTTTPENRYFKSHPCLLVEVLSPSMESVDRGEKLFNYRTIPELNSRTSSPTRVGRGPRSSVAPKMGCGPPKPSMGMSC